MCFFAHKTTEKDAIKRSESVPHERELTETCGSVLPGRRQGSDGNGVKLTVQKHILT